MPIIEGQSLPPTTCSHNAPGQPQVAEAGRSVLCRQCGAVPSLEARGVNANNEAVPASINPTTPTATSTGVLAQYPGHSQI
jgi:hypothetical protein